MSLAQHARSRRVFVGSSPSSPLTLTPPATTFSRQPVFLSVLTTHYTFLSVLTTFLPDLSE